VFCKAAERLRASGPLSAETTAVGKPFGSVLIA
jgi:hypothetical protein